MIKKGVIFFVVIIFLCSETFATDIKTKLNVINQSSETKYLENNQGFISKTIIDSNPDKGEAVIELKLSNTKKEISEKNNTEIVLAIDISKSMDFKTVDGKTRKSIVIDSAKNLVNNIFEASSTVKVGVVTFAGGLYASSINTSMTDDKKMVLDCLQRINNSDTWSSTNIQGGLRTSKKRFSENAKNKVIILLTDGCPNEDENHNNIGNNDMVMTNETYQKILANTKSELISIKNDGIKLISLMTGVNSNDIDMNGNVVTNTEDDLKAIKEIFGTEENPTAGKFYNAKTADVNKVVSEDITRDISEIFNSPINTVKIVDYFPDEIKNNFDFEYVGNQSIGTRTENINVDNNTIEWNIENLKGEEVATLKYKLKIKDMKNSSLLNKVISTNEKVVLTYKDTNMKDYTVVLSSSPKIQLTEVKDIIVDNSDKTTAKGSLPQTGADLTIVFAIFTIIIIALVIYKKYKKFKDIK